MHAKNTDNLVFWNLFPQKLSSKIICGQDQRVWVCRRESEEPAGRDGPGDICSIFILSAFWFWRQELFNSDWLAMFYSLGIFFISGWPEDLQLRHRGPRVGKIPRQLDHWMSPVCLQGGLHKPYLLSDTFNIPWVFWQYRVNSSLRFSKVSLFNCKNILVVSNPEQFHFRSLFPAYLKLVEDKTGSGGLSK